MRRPKKRTVRVSLLIVITIVVLLASRPNVRDSLSQAATSNQPGLYAVTKFVDGDTIKVNMNGAIETVRFIGVDTPETHKPNTPVQCYGPQAATFTKQFIGGNKVSLQADPEDTDRDRYGRLLRYVSLPDGSVVNAELIKRGYGFYYPYFPFSRKAEFLNYELAAQTDHKGLWSTCKPTKTDDGGYLSNSL